MERYERFGFVRVAAATPRTVVADPGANLAEHVRLIRDADDRGCDLVVFPELSLTGYTCADLFHQKTLLERSLVALQELCEEVATFQGLILVGLPFAVEDRLYNCAAALHRGRVIGLVPKSHLPNYREFYERRWFLPGGAIRGLVVDLFGEAVPFGVDLLFEAEDLTGFTVGVEICEDLWVPIPPSCDQALAGATVLVNLSASNESTGKSEYRRSLVVQQSGRCLAGYVYTSSGVQESTTDLVFGGHRLIAECGSLMAEGKRFERRSPLTIADLDVQRIAADRWRLPTFVEPERGGQEFRRVTFEVGSRRWNEPLERVVPGHPFVPSASGSLGERCQEIFETQVAGLAKRVESAGLKSLHIGVSGGLDSTLALLVAAKTCDALGLERRSIHGLTMPGFGTSDRTRNNASELMRWLGVSASTVDIRPLCLDLFRALGHRPFGIELEGRSLEEIQQAFARLEDHERKDLVFENVQARVRTLLLMSRGFVVGTGDLSEMALGWSTYNADHMSMYNPNAGIPKTLVRFLVRWAADHEFQSPASEILHSIADSVISPELLPVGPGQEVQCTESTIGPYELHDFFLYYLLRYGFEPRKVLFLARQATFDGAYGPEEQRRWLKVFYQRFFASQYKRSCVPDGPKIGSVSLSPRGDWRMPSDASASAWLEQLENEGD